MRRFVVASLAVALAATAGCSGGSKSSSTRTTRKATTTTTRRITTTSPPATTPVPTTDPAPPGVVNVDLAGSAARVDVPPDAVVATFTFGSGPDQLGFVPGQQADNITPAGFVLTQDETALIVDVVNRRLVPVAVPAGTRRPSPAAPDLCDGNLRLGPQAVLYIACQERAALGINAFATAGPRVGQRLAGPSGQANSQMGTPIVFTPTAVVDEAGSARPLPYVTATGAPLPNPNLPAEPTATVNGASTRITYRTEPGAALRTWDVVPPSTGGALPILVTALPDATVVVVYAYGFESPRLLIARLTSHGVARAVSFPYHALSNYQFVQADATGAYVLEHQDWSGARLVRYRLGG